jgi:hypothetical protein
MENQNKFCNHIFTRGKRKGQTCGVYCRKTRDDLKCYAHTPRTKCPHNREKSKCKECGGSQICEHNRIKSQCKECGGSQICEHNRAKSTCKECGGSQICPHNQIKFKCKECNFKGYILNIVNARISEALNRYDEKGGVNRLGCNIEEFIKHINEQLENQEIPEDRLKMTWENYTTIWEFDHIIPIFRGNFKYLTIETVLCRLHFTNIQPLYIDMNQKKGNRE